MIPREAASALLELAKGFPILAVTGPRQSGKTTLTRATFPTFEYLSLEDLDVRAEAAEDPRGFLQRRRAEGFILDEAQHVPELFSYLQTFADEQSNMGQIILTGSQNFRLMESVSQSLAGRVGLIELLPLRWKEVKDTDQTSHQSLDEVIFSGFYPPIYDRHLQPADWYPRYVQTYIDRDVRTLRNIGNLASFQKFVRLCAGRIGQLINFTSLANETGIDTKTAQSWLSILEASYLIVRLQPFHRNFNKRLVKQPKLYFTDTGVACALLGIEEPRQLETHYLRGGLFENWVLMELLKSRFNAGRPSNLYFWRDHQGHEIDILRTEGDRFSVLEVKAGATLHDSFFENLHWFANLSGDSLTETRLVYGGDRSTARKGADVVGWRDI